MSVVNPKDREYETHDGLKVARDVAWVIRTLWSGAIVLVLAAMWVATLAADVSQNTETHEERAAGNKAIPSMVEALERIEKKLDEADTRQRDIQSNVDKLGTKVEALEEAAKED